MELVCDGTVLRMVAKSLGKPCMLVELYDQDCPSLHVWRDDYLLAAPYLRAYTSLFRSYPRGIITFDTEEEMNHCFDQTVGEAGPTESNQYNGPFRIYALTCSATGELGRDNSE